MAMGITRVMVNVTAGNNRFRVLRASPDATAETLLCGFGRVRFTRTNPVSDSDISVGASRNNNTTTDPGTRIGECHFTGMPTTVAQAVTIIGVG